MLLFSFLSPNILRSFTTSCRLTKLSDQAALLVQVPYVTMWEIPSLRLEFTMKLPLMYSLLLSSESSNTIDPFTDNILSLHIVSPPIALLL